MIIKVCGMREADNIRAVEKLPVSWMGFIFWPKSSRFVDKRPDYLPERAMRVGVFVDAEVDEVLRYVAEYDLEFVQLHGSETPAYITLLRQQMETMQREKPVGVIKALNIATEDDVKRASDYDATADYLLFDTKGKSVGGNGTQFDWEVLNAYHGTKPFLLSGGIGRDDAAKVRNFHHPRCIGIDLNSRFEVAPARKDITALNHFINELYEQD